MLLKNPPLSEVPIGYTVWIKTNVGVGYVGVRVLAASAESIKVATAKGHTCMEAVVPASAIVNLVARP